MKKKLYKNEKEINRLCIFKKLSLNKGNYALKIDGGRQTDKVSYRGASLLKIKERSGEGGEKMELLRICFKKLCKFVRLR